MGKFEIAAIIGGIAILFFYSQLERPLDSPASGQPNPSSATTPVDAAPNAAGLPSSIYGQRVKNAFQATSIAPIDGDSLKATLIDGSQVEIRLASIDAPELKQTFGQPAKAHLQSLTVNRPATFFQTDTDRYGRTVAFMFVRTPQGQELSINAQMLVDGLAWHSISFSSDATLTRLEEDARLAKRGLWNQRSPVAPWIYRAKK